MLCHKGKGEDSFSGIWFGVKIPRPSNMEWRPLKWLQQSWWKHPQLLLATGFKAMHLTEHLLLKVSGKQLGFFCRNDIYHTLDAPTKIKWPAFIKTPFLLVFVFFSPSCLWSTCNRAEIWRTLGIHLTELQTSPPCRQKQRRKEIPKDQIAVWFSLFIGHCWQIQLGNGL